MNSEGRSRYWENELPDTLWDPRLQSSVEKDVKDHLAGLLNEIARRNSPSSIASSGDASVYTGGVGIALMHLRLALSNPGDYGKNGLEECASYLQASESFIEDDVSFICGEIGFHAVRALHAHHALKSSNRKTAQDIIQASTEAILAVKSSALKSKHHEVLYGLAGYVYSLLVMKRLLNTSNLNEAIRDCVERLLKHGKAGQKEHKSGSPLYYVWHDRPYLGAAHGLMGILHVLLDSDALTKDEIDELIRPTLRYIAGIKFPGSRNFPSALGEQKHVDEDYLKVHWCHGATGAVLLFSKAFNVLGDETYLVEAISAAQCVWERGLIRKGLGLCHGISGNGYCFLTMFDLFWRLSRATNNSPCSQEVSVALGIPKHSESSRQSSNQSSSTTDSKSRKTIVQVTPSEAAGFYLNRALQFQRFSLKWLELTESNEMCWPDRPYSLFEGFGGAVCFSADLLACIRDFSASSSSYLGFPAFHVM